ncbi:MAG: transglycosylase SLT domain-containing protein [bacterium]|nr:transglycosylase SLT domain-containing protein [bacterium]
MLNKKQKGVFFFLFFVFFIFCANFILAVEFRAPEINYPQLPFPGVDSPQVFLEKIQKGEIPEEQALPLYVKYFYYLSLMIAGLLALGIMVYGGFLYLISAGAPVKMIAAKDQITGGILGFVVLLSSYLILATINPQLVIFRLPGLEKVTGPEIEVPPLEKKVLTYFQIPTGIIIENAVLNEKAQEKLDFAYQAAKTAAESAESLYEKSRELHSLVMDTSCGNSECDDKCQSTGCDGKDKKDEITKKIEETNEVVKELNVSLMPGEMITGIGFVPTTGYCSLDYLGKFWNKESLGNLWYEGLLTHAAQVCNCESGGRPTIEGPTDDYGLFQVHFPTWEGWWNLEKREQLYNPEFNINFAIKIYKHNNSWWPWVCARKLGIVR